MFEEFYQNLRLRNVQPCYIFMTGGAGVGKFHLVKTMYMYVVM